MKLVETTLIVIIVRRLGGKIILNIYSINIRAIAVAIKRKISKIRYYFR